MAEVVRNLTGESVSDEERDPSRAHSSQRGDGLSAVSWQELPDVDIRLLGSETIALEGAPLEGLGSSKLLELLARLVLSPELSLERSRLAFELWPDSTDSQARTNLRHLLHDLRRGLPHMEHFVEVDRKTIRWRSDSPASVDVIRFREALEAGALEQAVSDYGGELLPGSYSDFVLEERARLAGEVCECLRRLAEAALECGDHDGAVAWGRRLLAMDPLSEGTYRLLMSANAARGERATALRLYHACADMLSSQLGAEPSAATRRMYESLWSGAPSSQGAEPSLRDSAPPALIGRGAPWSRVIGSWTAARSGQTQLLVITGEAGVGKSRLLEELARTAASEGGRVGRARAYEFAGRLPWGPVVDWLRSDAVRPMLGHLDSAWAAELARLVPDLVPVDARASEDRADGAATDSFQRRRLLDALGAALTAGSEPLLLVVDDLQWCDADSMELIGFLLSTVRTAPLLVAAGLRDDEVSRDHPLLRLVDSLRRDGAGTSVGLERLDAESTTDLVEQLVGHPVDDVTVQQLFEDTEGNPLFVVEAVRAGLDDRDPRMSLTPTVQAVIRSRLARLGPDSRRLLEVAAMIGRNFTFDELAATTEWSADDLVEGLDELWQSQVIREERGAYDFSHDKIREVAYSTISPARRLRLHREVALGLDRSHSRSLGPVSSQLAAHFEHAGMLPEAIAALRRAAAWSVEVFALDDAIVSLRHAIRLLEDLPPGQARDATELDLQEQLGVPLVSREGYGSLAAVDAYQRAVALSGHLGRPVRPPVLRGLGLAELVRCRFDRSSKHGAALLASRTADATAEVEANYLLGVSAFWRGQLELAREHLESAIEAYRPELSVEHRARYAQDPKAVCLIRLALTLWFLGEPASAFAVAAESRSFAEWLDHPMTHSYVLTYAQFLSAEAEDLKALEELVEAAEPLWTRQPMSYFMTADRLMRAWLELRLGSPEALGELLGAVEQFRAEGETLHLSYGLTLVTRAHLEAGRVSEGREAAAEGILWSREHDQGYLEAELWRLDGELLSAAGHREEAGASLRQALDLAVAQGSHWLELRSACSMAAWLSGSGVADDLLRSCLGRVGAGDMKDRHRAEALLRAPDPQDRARNGAGNG